MPHFTYYDDTSAVWSTSVSVSAAQIRQQYKEWVRECERQDSAME